MSPGVWSTFMIIALLILVYTGWLSQLAKELDLTHHQLIFGLLFCLFCQFLPSIGLYPSYEMTPGIVAMIGISLFLMYQLKSSRILAIYIKIVLLGTIIFIYHELVHIQTNWADSSFRMMVISVTTLLSLYWSKRLSERLLMQMGSLLYSHGLILTVYAEILEPLPIGQKTFLDTCWISICYILVVHYGLKSFFSWRKMQTGGNG